MPAYNERLFLAETLPAFRAAVASHGAAELVIVDNGSTEPLWDQPPRDDRLRLVRLPRSTIAAARNAGAEAASGEVLAFCDADCLVRSSHLKAVEELLREEAVAAVGNDPGPSGSGNWIEDTWERLHADPVGVRRRDRDVPAANFTVTARAFEAVGGFDPRLVTGEDAELCQRLRGAGHEVLYAPELEVVHLGNPRTVPDFFRRNVWHGLGMFGTASRDWTDKPTLATFAHLLLTAVAVAVLLLDGPLSGLAALTLSQLSVPAASVAFRCRRRRCSPGLLLRGLVLYWIYLWARVWSLVLVTLRLQHRYRSWTARRRDGDDWRRVG